MEQVFINGSMEHRVAHNLNISFNYVEGEFGDHGDQGIGAFFWIGLYFGKLGAQLCVARLGAYR